MRETELRILVVEDHHDSLLALQRLLQRAGHVVLTADSVKAAQAVAQSANFDLVIGDVGLPDGDGCELMRTLRETRGVGCIAVSGYAAREDYARALAAGVCVHLCKPIAFQQLLEAIEECRPKTGSATATA